MDMDPDDPKTHKNKAVRSKTFDNVRYLLPAGTGTNVACVINLRDARNMIASLRGHTNPELRLLGELLSSSTKDIAPILFKHTEPEEFRLPIKRLGKLSPKFNPNDPQYYADIYRPHLLPSPELETEAFEILVSEMHGMNWDTFDKFMEGRPEHTEVPDIFKTVQITFDMMMDYGSFRDLQRHRRCEQYLEPLTADYGYLVPDDIINTELEPEFRSAMELLPLYHDESVVHNTDLMQYMIPLGYLHRSRFQMDLRELYYIVELRTRPQNHFSYRKMASQMYSLTKARWPKLMKWCRVGITS